MVKNLLAFILSAGISSLAFSADYEPVWSKIKTKDGIEVFRGEIKDSDIVAFRGIGMVDASLVAVTSVMINIERKLHWVAKIKEAKVVKQLSNFERIEYNQTKAPWPIANRDFVFHAKLTPSPDLKTVLVTIQSTEDDAEPVRDGVVRGALNSSRFFLESINDQQTRVTVEIHADPKGSIPKWVVNLFQKGWPLDTINGIRKEVVSPEFAIHPKAKEALSPAKLTELP